MLLLKAALTGPHRAQLGSCTQSAMCYPQYERVLASVIAIYAINLSLGAMALCTGARPEPHNNSIITLLSTLSTT